MAEGIKEGGPSMNFVRVIGNKQEGGYFEKISSEFYPFQKAMAGWACWTIIEERQIMTFGPCGRNYALLC